MALVICATPQFRLRIYKYLNIEMLNRRPHFARRSVHQWSKKKIHGTDMQTSIAVPWTAKESLKPSSVSLVFLESVSCSRINAIHVVADAVEMSHRRDLFVLDGRSISPHPMTDSISATNLCLSPAWGWGNSTRNFCVPVEINSIDGDLGEGHSPMLRIQFVPHVETGKESVRVDCVAPQH